MGGANCCHGFIATASPLPAGTELTMDDPASPIESAEGPDQGAGVVVAPKPKREKKQREVPRYHVILWDSDDHTYYYVETMLLELFGYDEHKSHQMAEEVDKQGRVIVLTTTLEHAELKRDQIHAYGPDKAMASSKGPMWASIEPAG
ncbi:ATP-dependent Clp protease adaptor [Pirellulimonas nuda]|uniref:ATP-dependent Clp protease adaptor n=1 Tax=Pirellulimonas nuda TaxID=2528009 RepID=A0A518DI94_9BACT|nr:ATP-dependent Clp protease adaptor ClpS [Pirellulimonas nuda]QDU91207.1 ATP-dependent Clp protease adaptor [Pirellulimonas nuda]